MTMIASRNAARLAALAFSLCCALAHADPLARQVDFSIAPQRLVDAIVQFSERAQVQVISSGTDVTDQRTTGVIGRHTVADALSALLKGTGLRYKALNDGTVSLQAIKQSPGSTQMQSEDRAPIALAQAENAVSSSSSPQAADMPSASSASASNSETPKLSEIIVTAQKRSERLISDGVVIVDKGDAVGTVPQVPSPWNVTASTEYSAGLANGAVLTLRAEDVFHSRNSGPFASYDPRSISYASAIPPNPSTNAVQLRMSVTYSSVDLALFVNNALNAHPALMRSQETPATTSFYNTTFRPRTAGLSATWRF